jgi:glycosyltransferase involved in cell wall biosynthesis
LRVGFFTSHPLDTLTGGYVYDRQLVDYMRLKKHQVDVIHLPPGGYLSHLLSSPQLLVSSPLTGKNYDILIEDELDHPVLTLFNLSRRSQGNCPVITIVHNLHCSEPRANWENRFYRRMEKLYLGSVDGFVFNSRTTRKAVEKLIGVPRLNVIAWPGGDRLPSTITEAEVVERAKQPGPLRVLFLGNLFKNKALHVLLDAMAALPHHSCQLSVVGDLTMDKTYVKTIRNQIRKLNLDENVEIHGPLNNGELAAQLRGSHILVVPSFYEGYGIAYLEGMGFGLPAIATSAGAAGEIITHGRNGFLIEPGDSVTLSSYLRQLNEQRGRLSEMGIEALHSFKYHPTWEFTCGNILDFFESCTRTGSR